MSDLFSPVSILSKLSLQKAQRNLDDSKSFLYNDFRGMAKILSLYNPLEVMKMSLWEERRIYALSKKDEVKRKAAVLLPIVLQSIVESDMMEGVGTSTEIKEKDWERTKSLSEDIVRRMARIIDSMVAIAINKGDADSDTAEGLRKSIEKRLLPDFVDRNTQDRDIWNLRSLFEEIPDFQSRMGCDYISFVLNVQNIARVGVSGIDDLVRDVALYKEEYSLLEAQMRASGELDGLNESQIFDKITKKNHWEGRAAALTERRDGYSLFMPSTSSSLPLDAFAQYSVKASSLKMDAFLSRGFWPAVRYPFFEMEGKVYTFVGKHLPFFLSLTSLIDRFLASSRDVLSIFFLSDCDTYTYDGNKVEISVLPSVLDINPVLYPSSYRDVIRRRKAEGSVQRKLGHKKLVVDPDMGEDMENKDDVLYISSSFLSRATVDKNTKRDLLSSLLGTLDLPEEESVYQDTDDYVETTEPSNDDLNDEKSSYDYEYEYNDVDEDELAKKLDERDENITLIEYDKTLPTEEEKKSLIDRYSLTDEIIRKSEEEEKLETQIEDALDDDIFDDSEEEEHLDDIGGYGEESKYFEEVEAADEYVEEEKTVDDDGQLDFFSILDEEDPEEIEFDNELDQEEEESFQKEEKREELLDSDIVLPSDSDIPAEEEIIEKEEDISEVEEADTPEDETEYFYEPREDASDDSIEKISEDEEIEESPLATDEYESDDSIGEIEEESEEEIEVEEEESEESVSDEIDTVDTPQEEIPVEEEIPQSIEEPEVDSTEEIEEDPEDSVEVEEECVSEDLDYVDVSQEEEESVQVKEESEIEEVPEDNSINEETPSPEDDGSLILDDEDDEQTLPMAEVETKPAMSFADSLFAALGLEDEEDEEEQPEEAPIEEETVEEVKEEPVEEPKEEAIEEPVEESEEEPIEEEPLVEEESFEEEERESQEELSISGVIGEIYKLLGPTSTFAEFIKLSDEDTLSDLDEAIENCWNRQQMEGKDKMFNIPDYSLSIILARDSVRDELRLSELLNNAGGVMYSRDSESWNAIIVYIDPEHVVEKALEKTISKDTFSSSDWKRVTYIGEQMKKR